MNTSIVLLIAVASLLCSCDSETSTTETSGGGLPGDIVGKVNLLDTTGNEISDRSGVLVTIERTPFSATSDSDGVFRLLSVPPGTYTFRYEKDGFATTKHFSIQHTGNGTLYLKGYVFNTYDVNLYKIPEGKVELTLTPFEQQLTYRDSSWVDSLGQVKHTYLLDSALAATFSYAPLRYHPNSTYPLLYFGKNEHIAPHDPNSYSFITFLRNGGDGKYSVAVWKDSLTKHGVTPGSRVFVQTARHIAGYYDVEARAIVNTYGYFSEVRSFILP